MVADLKLHWVLKDPGSERAVDALGMGGQAERIANALLPDISVATTRARYLSFFCRVIQETEGVPQRLQILHRIEAKLALKECELHKKENGEPDHIQDCPGVVGIQKAQYHLKHHGGKWPNRPEVLYKTTAFNAYQPLMRALGLIEPGRALKLTSAGDRLARAYRSAGGKPPRCLSEIGSAERSQLRGMLGLDSRLQCSAEQQRRRETYEQVKTVFAESSPNEAVHGTVLRRYQAISARARAQKGAAWHLHRAYAWEVLSLGLSLAFAMILEEKNVVPVASALRKALRRRPRVPEIDASLGPNDGNAAANVVALLRLARSLNMLRLELDPEPHYLAACLIAELRPEEFVRRLVRRHEQAKMGEAWVTLRGNRLIVLAPDKSKSFFVSPRTYRLDAFRQLVRDLGMPQ